MVKNKHNQYFLSTHAHSKGQSKRFRHQPMGDWLAEFQKPSDTQIWISETYRKLSVDMKFKEVVALTIGVSRSDLYY